jgi:hypothetical protein
MFGNNALGRGKCLVKITVWLIMACGQKMGQVVKLERMF